jgi:hypothetical protein
MKYVTAEGGDSHAAVAECVGQILAAAAREVIEDANLRHWLVQQRIDRVRSDKPRATDDEDALASQVHPLTPLADFSAIAGNRFTLSNRPIAPAFGLPNFQLVGLYDSREEVLQNG